MQIWGMTKKNICKNHHSYDIENEPLYPPQKRIIDNIPRSFTIQTFKAFGHIVTNIFGNEKKPALPANPSVVNLPDELGQVEEEKVQKPVEEEAG